MRRWFGVAAIGVVFIVGITGCGPERGDSDDGPRATEFAIVTATPPKPATPLPIPADGYAVQEGDTLSTIATKFGVAESSIVEANALADPNSLAVGQVLMIPQGATPTKVK